MALASNVPWVIFTTDTGLFSAVWDLVSASWTPEPERIDCLNQDCAGGACPFNSCPSPTPGFPVPDEQLGHGIDVVFDPSSNTLHACWITGAPLRPPAQSELDTGGASLWYSTRVAAAGVGWPDPELISSDVGYSECAIDVGLGIDETQVPFIAASAPPRDFGVLLYELRGGGWFEKRVFEAGPQYQADLAVEDSSGIIHLVFTNLYYVVYASGAPDIDGEDFFVEAIPDTGTLPSLAVDEAFPVPHVAFSDLDGVVKYAVRSVPVLDPTPDPGLWSVEVVAPTGATYPLEVPEVSSSFRNVAGLATGDYIYGGIPTTIAVHPGGAARIAFVPHIKFDASREDATPPVPGEIRLDGLYLATRTPTGTSWFLDLVDARVDRNGVPSMALSSFGYARVAYHNAAVSAGDALYWQEEDARELVRDEDKVTLNVVQPWPACEALYGRLDGPLALTNDHVAFVPDPIDFAPFDPNFANYEAALGDFVIGMPDPEDGFRGYFLDELAGGSVAAELPTGALTCATSWDDLSACGGAAIGRFLDGDGTMGEDECGPGPLGLPAAWTDAEIYRLGLASNCLVHLFDGFFDAIRTGATTEIRPGVFLADALNPSGLIADIFEGAMLLPGEPIVRDQSNVCIPNDECPPGLFNILGCPDDPPTIVGPGDPPVWLPCRAFDFDALPCPGGTGEPPCSLHRDCIWSNTVCNDGRCGGLVACATGADCDVAGSFECYPFPEAGLSACARPRSSCVVDEQCRSNEGCSSGLCVRLACSDDDDCRGNSRCESGACAPSIKNKEAFVFEPTDSFVVCQKLGCFSCVGIDPVDVVDEPDYCGPGIHECPPGHTCSAGAGWTSGRIPLCNLRPVFRDWRLDAILSAATLGPDIVSELDALRSVLRGVRVPMEFRGRELSMDETFEEVRVALVAEPGLDVPAQGFVEIALRFSGPLEVALGGCVAGQIEADAPAWLRLRLAPSFTGPPGTGTGRLGWALVEGAIVKDPSGVLHDADAGEITVGCVARMSDGGQTPPEILEDIGGGFAAALAPGIGPLFADLINAALTDGLVGGWILGRTEALKELDIPREGLDGNPEDPTDQIYDILVTPGAGIVRFREVD